MCIIFDNISLFNQKSSSVTDLKNIIKHSLQRVEYKLIHTWHAFIYGHIQSVDTSRNGFKMKEGSREPNGIYNLLGRAVVLIYFYINVDDSFECII